MVIAQSSPRKMTPKILEECLADVAVRMIALAQHFEDGITGRMIASQVVRSGTSPAANYAESRSTESRAGILHKLRIVVKELNEIFVWSRIIKKAELIPANKLIDLENECSESKRILGAPLRTTNSGAVSDQ